MMKSDVICLQETWLESDIIRDDLKIENYDLHLNGYGKGKGIAIYYKKGLLKHKVDIKEENMQLTQFSSSALDIVVLYRSQNGDIKDLKQHLEAMNSREKPLLVIGDFNFCFKEKSSNAVNKYLQQNYFSQLIEDPTHIAGNLIDQAHVRDVIRVHTYSTELHSKYYSDHKALTVLVKKSLGTSVQQRENHVNNQ